MRKEYDTIRQLGAEVLAVTLSQPKVVAAYLKENPWPFPVVCDPERTAYARFALARTPWTSFLRPTVIAGYLSLIFQGWKPRAPNAGEDPMQLGGDFILDEKQHLLYAYRSKTATDRPDVQVLIEKLKI